MNSRQIAHQDKLRTTVCIIALFVTMACVVLVRRPCVSKSAWRASAGDGHGAYRLERVQGRSQFLPDEIPLEITDDDTDPGTVDAFRPLEGLVMQKLTGSEIYTLSAYVTDNKTSLLNTNSSR